MFEDWLTRTGKWLEGTGPQSDIAVSSRIRLARNLQGKRYTTRITVEQADEVKREIQAVSSQTPSLKDAFAWGMAELSAVDRHFLAERHVISHDLAERAGPGSGVIVARDERMGMMVNEEDHIRLQIIQSGLDLESAWKQARETDRELSKTLTYAYSPSWGYLNCCPTNTGTGLRASVMLHLPALVFEHKAEKILQRASSLGLMIRGLYGEGRDVKSVFFQVSNQVSLGLAEEEIIEHVTHLTRQLMEHERVARDSLVKHQRTKIEDTVWRAFGLLRHARMLTSAEATDLLSTVRLGVELGFITNLSIGTMNELLILAQSAHIQKRLSHEGGEVERDVRRAEFFRERLKTSPNPR